MSSAQQLDKQLNKSMKRQMMPSDSPLPHNILLQTVTFLLWFCSCGDEVI
jgi:hypothetical protein